MVKVSQRTEVNNLSSRVTNYKKVAKHARRCQKNLHKDQKKKVQSLLTNERLTIPHMQFGIFLKGKTSASYHRKKETNFNALNKARINEKLAEILHFPTRKSLQETIYDDSEDIHSFKSYDSKEKEEKEIVSLSSSLSSTTRHENSRKESQTKCCNVQKTKRTSSTSNEYKRHNNRIQSSHENVNSYYQEQCHTKNRDKGDVEYTNFKMFLVYFEDDEALPDTLPIDFITKEKVDLKKKKRNFSQCNSAHTSDTEKRKSINYLKEESDVTEKQIGPTICPNHNTSKPAKAKTKMKRKPNYETTKNPIRDEIIDKMEKYHKHLNLNNVFLSDHNSEDSQIAMKDERLKEKYNTLMNPLNFLTSSLQEIDKNSSSSTLQFSDEYKFVKPAFNLSVSTPKLVVPELQTMIITPKILPQQYKMLDKNEPFHMSEINAMHKQSPWLSTDFEEYPKSSKHSTEQNENFFEDIFSQKISDEFGSKDKLITLKPLVEIDDHNVSPFHNHTMKLNTSKKTLSLSEQAIFDIYGPNIPRNSQEIMGISNSQWSPLENADRHNDPTDKWNNFEQHYNSPVLHLVKINASSTQTNEVQIMDNNIWHRRKMF